MNLYFRKTGSGPSLIILHGLFGSSDNWYSISRSLSGSFTVYAVDQRNHGQSPHSPVHTYDALSDDLLQFIIHHKIEKPFIIGHSMGGKALMHFALKNPGLIQKMIVVDISPRSYKSLQNPTPDTLEILNIMAALRSVETGKLQSREEADAQLTATLPDKNLRSFLLKNLRHNAHNQFEWCFNLETLYRSLPGILDGIDGSQAAASSDIKTLFIRGSHSGYINESDTSIIGSLFPLSRIHTIAGAGHWVHAEQPERFVEAVKEFLSAE